MLYWKYFGDGRSQGAVIQETSNFCQGLGSRFPPGPQAASLGSIDGAAAGVTSSGDNDALRDEHCSCPEGRSILRALAPSVEGPKEELSFNHRHSKDILISNTYIYMYVHFYIYIYIYL